MTHRNLFVSAADGLELYARDYGPPASPALPVVCLPGLSRTSADFDELALALSESERRPRRVLALDYRGRGRSERDTDWRRYDIKIEAEDVLQILAAAGVHEAVLVGTSRGGLIAMLLSALRPTVIRGVVLNDVGPALETKGLLRIRSYLGQLPSPRDWSDGADILRRVFDAQFPAFGAAEWETMARGTWIESEGRLVAAHDPALARTLEGLDVETRVPTVWPLFEGLRRVPLLVLRGERSDLLSAETVEAMARAHPDCETVVVPGQGHPPLLTGRDLMQRIRRFVVRAEETPRAAPA